MSIEEDLDRVFEEAAGLPSEERGAFVEKVCAGKPALCAAVYALLADFERLDREERTERPPASEPAGDDALDGPQIGPYRLIKELGRGGMGVVYLAARDDGQFEQEVALKLVQPGRDPAPLLRRFFDERQILARLAHPNIARLLDGGVDGGRPYFTMEYVEGECITDYCDRHWLTVEARLALFEAVCEGVHYAHQRLVVHRDLKPSNVFVTEDERGRPQPKLLDFGIAKVLAEDEPDGAALTQMSALSPAYAAPEQMRGEAVTTATDVYALGVLLYELLTGRWPYELAGQGATELERVVCEEEPERPSTVIARAATCRKADGTTETRTPEVISRARSVGPEGLRRRLQGDLDAIVLKALAKEPKARYRSAEALSDDVRHHLGRRPVAARRGSTLYRADRFVRRYPFGVGAASAFVLLLVAAVVGLAFAQRQTAHERDRAENLRRFTFDLFRQANPNEVGGDTLTALDLLERGARRVRLQLAGQPEVRAEMQEEIGWVYLDYGRYEDAARLLEEALDVRRDQGDDAATGRTLFLLGDAWYNQGDRRAEQAMRESIALRRRALGARHPDVAESLLGLAAVLFEDAGAHDEAERLYLEALAIRRAALGEGHLAVAESRAALGSFLQLARRDAARAEPLLRRALAVQLRRLGKRHSDVAETMTHLGMAVLALGDYDEAERLHREALALHVSLFGSDHYDTLGMRNNLALTLIVKGDYREAEALYRQVLDGLEGTQGDEQEGRASASLNLATALDGQGRHAEAERYARASVGFFEGTLGREGLKTAAALHTWGLTLHGGRRLAEAEAALREALALRLRLDAEPLPVVLTRTALADLLAERGADAEAERLYRAAVSVAGTPGESGDARAEALLGLGRLLTRRGRAAEAEPLLREAVGYYQKTRAAGHADLVEARAALAACRALLEP